MKLALKDRFGSKTQMGSIGKYKEHRVRIYHVTPHSAEIQHEFWNENGEIIFACEFPLGLYSLELSN